MYDAVTIGRYLANTFPGLFKAADDEASAVALYMKLIQTEHIKKYNSPLFQENEDMETPEFKAKVLRCLAFPFSRKTDIDAKTYTYINTMTKKSAEERV